MLRPGKLGILRLMPVVLMLVVDWMSYSSSENSTAEAKTEPLISSIGLQQVLLRLAKQLSLILLIVAIGIG